MQDYNAQALVDVESKLIFGNFLTHQTNAVAQVEPGLATLQSLSAALGAMRFRQLLRHGLEGARGEWNLLGMAFNPKRMHALARL